MKLWNDAPVDTSTTVIVMVSTMVSRCDFWDFATGGLKAAASQAEEESERMKLQASGPIGVRVETWGIRENHGCWETFTLFLIVV